MNFIAEMQILKRRVSMLETKIKKQNAHLTAAYVKLIENHSEEEIENACDCFGQREFYKCKLCVARDILKFFGGKYEG